MKPIKLVLLICGVFCAALSRAQAVDFEQLQRAIVVTLITDDDALTARVGARSLAVLYPNDQQLTDLMAERLLVLTSSELSTGVEIRAARWHLQLLGDLRNPRYRDTVLAVRPRTQHADVLHEVDEALANIGDQAGEAYVAGSADLLRSRAEAQQVLKSQRRSSRPSLRSLPPRPSLQQVLEAFGAPDDVRAWRTRNDKLAISYADAGLFLMGPERLPTPRLVSSLIYPELVRVKTTYTGPDYGRAQILGSVRGKPLMQYYKRDRRRVIANMDEMQILVRRILEVPHATYHRYDERVLDQVLVDLWRSTNPRALELVAQVARMPGDNDFKDDAIKLIKRDRKEIEERAAEELEDVDDDDDDEEE